MPKVSVLITSYNYADYLPEAIESVLEQTYEDFELIIVDNCSDDHTVDIVKGYMQKDPRVKIHINEANIGMYRNYNQALLLASGDYIKFLNADDKFHPKLLDKFVHILDKNQDVSIVASYRQYFQGSNDLLKTDLYGRQYSQKVIVKALTEGNFIGEPTTVMFRKKNLTLGLFDISLLMFADIDMWLRQLQAGDLYIVNEVLSYFRKHEEQGTQSLNNHADKSTYNALQWAEYIRYAVQMNRYGYDLYATENNDTLRRVFDNSVHRVYKVLFKSDLHKRRAKNYFPEKKDYFTQIKYFMKYLLKRIFK